MSNRLFQGVIHQMRDVVERTIGVVDETGAVISCSDLGRIGEIRNVNTPAVFSSATPVACDGSLYQAFGTHMRPEYAVFVEGEDSVAQNYIGVLAVSLSSESSRELFLHRSSSCALAPLLTPPPGLTGFAKFKTKISSRLSFVTICFV